MRSVNGWRHACELPKLLRQMAVAIKAALERNFCNRRVGLFQELLCPFDPLLNQVLVRRCPYGLLEQVAEMELAHTEQLCQIGQFQVLIEMVMDVFQNLDQLALREPTGISCQTGFGRSVLSQQMNCQDISQRFNIKPAAQMILLEFGKQHHPNRF